MVAHIRVAFTGVGILVGLFGAIGSKVIYAVFEDARDGIVTVSL